MLDLLLQLKTNRYRNSESGFTLVETLVASSIFTVSVLAMIIILSGGLQNTSYAKEKITGEYLAQEGIEYVRNMRDTYMLYSPSADAGWNLFVGAMAPSPNTLCASSNGCYFDDQNVSFTEPNMPMTNLAFFQCSSATCSNAPLLYDSNTGKYGYASGLPSGFSRQIKITEFGSPVNEIKVSSMVYWQQASGTFSAKLDENMFDWIE